ncbi:MAG: HGxxPAAW family protein [Gulosibacter sp.]|uniref:HGxxPAAW family protein n=1 Tax=Gulosibacter sp. TaxID=2817531 RepID=UPI003F90CD8D
MSDKQVVLSRYHVEDEGNSVAGWIGVTIMILGFTVGTVGLFLASDIVTYIGVGAVVVGALAWPILKALGLGPKGHGH